MGTQTYRHTAKRRNPPPPPKKRGGGGVLILLYDWLSRLLKTVFYSHAVSHWCVSYVGAQCRLSSHLSDPFYSTNCGLFYVLKTSGSYSLIFVCRQCLCNTWSGQFTAAMYVCTDSFWWGCVHVCDAWCGLFTATMKCLQWQCVIVRCAGCWHFSLDVRGLYNAMCL